MNNKININEKIEELQKESSYYAGEDIGDIITEFAGYDNGYICDIISSIADANVDIYTSDLLEWNVSNYEYTEQAVDEFGMCDNRFDMIKAIQSGQYLFFERALYENLKNTIIINILTNVAEYCEGGHISEIILEDIELLADKEETNDQINIYIDEIIEKIKEENEESAKNG